MVVKYLITVMMPCLFGQVAFLVGMRRVVESSARSLDLTSLKKELLPATYSSIVDCVVAPLRSD